MGPSDRALRIGVLGAGQISQAAHLEACRKAGNAELYALCDADAGPARARRRGPRAAHHLRRLRRDARRPGRRRGHRRDRRPVPRPMPLTGDRSGQARAGREADGRLGRGVRGARGGGRATPASSLQVGTMRRFDPNIAYAREFIARADRRGARDAGLVLRLGLPLRDDRRAPAGDPSPSERPRAPAGRPQGRPPPLLPARPRQPPRRHRALPVRARSPASARSSPRSTAPTAGS